MLTRNHQVTPIGERTWMISEFGNSTMYVLEGAERALLIDTGTGIGDLQGVVRQITQLPLTVVITHAHVDHVCGAGQFDEIYIHPADIAQMNELTLEHRRWYARRAGTANGSLAEYSVEEDIVDWGKTPAVNLLHDGQTFDLGRRIVSVMETPGHSRGSVVFFDPKHRNLFSGDACSSLVLLDAPPEFAMIVTPSIEVMSVAACLGGLLRIKARGQEFDRNFTGHSRGGEPALPEVLDDLIGCCRAILDGTIEDKTYPDPVRSSHACATYRSVRIVYNETALHD